MRFVGVDLGSTFIKGALLDLNKLEIQAIRRFPFPSPLPNLPPSHREFNPATIVDTTRQLLLDLLALAPDAAGIVLCSQMHGLVFSTPTGLPLSNLISWQDQRTLGPSRRDPSTSSFALLQQSIISPQWFQEMGNEPRPGTPLAQLHWLKQFEKLPSQPCFASSLPSFVTSALANSPPVTDNTHAASYGLLNVRKNAWHADAFRHLDVPGISLPNIVPQGAVAGLFPFNHRRIPIHAAVGDFQCAQVGAFLQPDELSINISTGSSVIRLARDPEDGAHQLRPFFDGRFVKAVTHIPGGRALQAWIELLTEIPRAQALPTADPWEYILDQVSRVPHTDLTVHPSFYFGAMGDRGDCLSMREENMNIGHLFRATFEGMAENYAICAQRVWPEKSWRQLVFSGGVALKTGALRDAICRRLGQPHRLASSNEDTLLGLLVLAEAFSGRSPSVESAQEKVARHFASDPLVSHAPPPAST